MSDIVERLNDAIAMAQKPIGYGGTSSEDAYAKFDETALSYVPLMTDTKATITALREEVERLREAKKITRQVEAHHLQRALTAEAELTALRQRVVEVVKALLLHSGIADVTDEDKFPEDIEAERAARALVNETKEALDGK